MLRGVTLELEWEHLLEAIWP